MNEYCIVPYWLHNIFLGYGNPSAAQWKSFLMTNFLFHQNYNFDHQFRFFFLSKLMKTAIAEGLAQRIAIGDVPETIEGKKVITLDMGLLVAGTKYCGEFEERLKKLMEEIKQSDEIILFIDEVHTH
ncbi:intron-binding protein aquarius [Iris pallida]|uniref:Intron-binding protein aquarius n=1 Tax=Iris pallida TaxID=29817 RepID=A0AAX6IEY1_IRIPA|nr:intron-binding protein aquarius [Iris pallida]